MPDGVKVGEGYIEIRPELDTTAMRLARAEILREMQKSYDDETRLAVASTRNRIDQQLAYEKLGNNQIMQAAAALEKQRTAALAAAEKERAKVEESAANDRERALKARLAGEVSAYRLSRADMLATEEAASKARSAIMEREAEKAAGAVKKASSSGGGNFFTTLGGPNVINFLQGAGASLIISQLPVVLGTLSSMASEFAIAGAASGAFALAATGSISQVTAAMKEMAQGKLALSELPAEFQSFIPAVQEFQGQWRGFLAATRAPVFNDLAKGMGVAEDGLKRLIPLVNAAAEGISGSLDVIDNWVKSPAVANFLATVRQQAPEAIETMTRSLANIGTGLANLISGFAPAGQVILQVIENLTQQFSNWSAEVTRSQGFQDFVSYVELYGPRLIETLANVAVTVVHLVGALAPIAAVVTDILLVVSSLLAAISPKIWLAIAVAVTAVWVAMQGWAVIQSIITGFKSLSAVMATLSLIMGETSGTVIVLRLALYGLLATAGVLVVIGAIIAGLGALTSASGSASGATKTLTSDQQALADAFAASNGKIDENVRKLAAQQLESKGLLAAGQKAGISPQEMVDAYLGSPDDWQHVVDTMKARYKDLEAKIAKEQKEGKPYQADLDQLLSLGDAIGNAEKLSGSAQAAAASNQRLADGIGQAGSAAALATDLFQRYSAAKNAALGVDSQAGQVAQDVAKAYNDYQKSLTGVANAQYSESQAVKQAASANEQAARQVADSKYQAAKASQAVVDAQYAERQAQDAVRTAVQNLAQARDEAAKKLRDQADTELSAKIQLEQAQNAAAALGLYSGPLTDASTIARQRALLDLTQAQNSYNDVTAQGEILRRQGIDGQPNVIAAQKALQDAQHQEAQATLAVRDAQHSLAQAQQAVTDAIRNQQQTIENGKHSVAAAHQATLDAIAAEKQAKVAYDASSTALDGTSGSAQVATSKMQQLRGELAQSLAMDTGDAQAQLRDVLQYISAVKLLAANPDMTWQQAWSESVPPTAQLGRPNGADRGHGGFYTGGYTGAGSKYQEAGVVHAGEFVVPKETVDILGPGYFNRYLPGYALGGLVLPNRGVIPGQELTGHGIIQQALSDNSFTAANLSGGGAAIAAVQGWLRSIASDRYVLGGVGPSVFDCSGLVGDVWSKLTGHADWQRWFVTGTEEAFLRSVGFQPGTGTFTVGFSNEHTVGNLAGLAFEAANPVDGLHIGAGATPVTSMPKVFYLPQLGNRFVGAAGNVVHLPGLLGFPGGDYLAPLPPSYAGFGGVGDPGTAANVDAWISRAARFANIPSSWIPGIKTIIARESGGNPNAVNLTDSNAAAGDPSKGLMQVIHSTFERYRSPALPDNQFDPVANIVAAVNYIRSRYGSIFNVQQANPNLPPKGYKNGGPLYPGDLGFNETRDTEWVFNKDQLQQIGGTTHVHIHLDDEKLKGLIRVEIEEDSQDFALALRGGHGRKG